MSNRIANKHKRRATGEWGRHPGKFLKRLGAKRLRARANPRGLDGLLADSPGHRDPGQRRSCRTRSGVCPVCLSRLRKNARDTRYLHVCDTCGAALNRAVTCRYCNTHRVWMGNDGAFCKGCGAEAHRGRNRRHHATPGQQESET